MKKNKKSFWDKFPLILSLIMCLSVAMPSQAKVPDGKYYGDLKIYLQESLTGQMTDHEMHIKVIKENKEYSLLLDEFQVASFNIPALKCFADAKKSEKGLALEGDIEDLTGAFAITGNVKGYITNKGEVNLVYNLRFGEMPMSFVCKYVGYLDK